MILKLINNKEEDLFWNGSSWTAYEENAKNFFNKCQIYGEILNHNLDNYEVLMTEEEYKNALFLVNKSTKIIDPDNLYTREEMSKFISL